MHISRSAPHRTTILLLPDRRGAMEVAQWTIIRRSHALIEYPVSVLEATDHGVRIRLKAVPGASRDAIAGVLGDRLKVRVAAPPEGGRANEAIVRLLASALGVRMSDVAIVSGHTRAEKVAFAAGVDEATARRALTGQMHG
ncbi:MAG: DUF167 domain-containing protein [Phycisphaeraceae bacterium]|nr:DUF167 domain-containing protein [Phycisphaeraceae bacterium]